MPLTPRTFWGAAVVIPVGLGLAACSGGATEAVDAAVVDDQGDSEPLRPLGATPLARGQYDTTPIAGAPAMALPPAASLLGTMPPVGDQGYTQGSCVGWSVGYGLKSYQEQAERKWGVATPDHNFSPSFVYDQIKLGGNCVPPDSGGGAYIWDALQLLKSTGNVAISVMPYDPKSCSALPTGAMSASAAPYRIDSFRRLQRVDRIDDFKAQIASGVPVVASINVFKEFDKLKKDVMTSATGSSRGTHAIVLAAYDDGRNAIAIFNSWGTGWGDVGVGWVDYSIFTSKVVIEAYVAADHIESGVCLEGKTQACGVNQGQCVAGLETCTGGQWGPCIGEVGPNPEMCGDNIDNNCDGRVDEYCSDDRGLPIFLFDL